MSSTVIRRFYTGIGSRKVPNSIKSCIVELAETLNHRYHLTLRSGGADGCDTCFEIGSHEHCDIYLPCKNFNNNPSKLYNIPDEAYEIAEKYHPKWNHLSHNVQSLMARNVLQVLGDDLQTPSLFVVCWTPDGCEHHRTRGIETGGTGLAISVASDMCKLPVFNLKKRSPDNIISWLETYYW